MYIKNIHKKCHEISVLDRNSWHCLLSSKYNEFVLLSQRPLHLPASGRLWGGSPLLQELLFASVLVGGHALLELLNLSLTLPPVLMLSHTVLQSIVQFSTACAGDHSVHWIILILTPAPVVRGWRRSRCHPYNLKCFTINNDERIQKQYKL